MLFNTSRLHEAVERMLFFDGSFVSPMGSPTPSPNPPHKGEGEVGAIPIALSLLPHSALHHIDVFDGDGAAVAEVDDDDRQADGGFGCSDCEDEEGENLARQVT